MRIEPQLSEQLFTRIGGEICVNKGLLTIRLCLRRERYISQGFLADIKHEAGNLVILND